MNIPGRLRRRPPPSRGRTTARPARPWAPWAEADEAQRWERFTFLRGKHGHYLVGALEQLVFSISYMGCHHSNWLFSYCSRWLKHVKTTNQDDIAYYSMIIEMIHSLGMVLYDHPLGLYWFSMWPSHRWFVGQKVVSMGQTKNTSLFAGCLWNPFLVNFSWNWECVVIGFIKLPKMEAICHVVGLKLSLITIVGHWNWELLRFLLEDARLLSAMSLQNWVLALRCSSKGLVHSHGCKLYTSFALDCLSWGPIAYKQGN